MPIFPLYSNQNQRIRRSTCFCESTGHSQSPSLNKSSMKSKILSIRGHSRSATLCPLREVWPKGWESTVQLLPEPMKSCRPSDTSPADRALTIGSRGGAERLNTIRIDRVFYPGTKHHLRMPEKFMRSFSGILLKNSRLCLQGRT